MAVIGTQLWTFEGCAKAGADLLAIESIGGKDMHDEAMMFCEIDKSLFSLGVLGAMDMSRLMADMLKLIPADTIVFGNVDPASQFRNGTPESIREATLNILKDCSQHKNFVISSGCDVPPLSILDNIDSFFTAVKDFNKA